MKSQIKQIFNYFVKPIQWTILYIFDLYFKFTTSKKQTFVIGVDEVANSTYFLKKILGVSAVSVNFRPNKYYKNNRYDYSFKTTNNLTIYLLKVFYGPYLLAKLANQSDVFIYFWWTGFCVDREMDYKFLKHKEKKIVCIFVGSDIRSGKLTKEHFDKLDEDHFVNYISIINDKNETRVRHVAGLAQKYADVIFSPRKVQLSYLEDSVDFFMYMIKDEILYEREEKNYDEIKILHAPSNPLIKGTPLVRAAIKKLKVEGYKFQYIEMIDQPNEEVLKLLEESDIVLNQFYAAMPGVFGIEAMAKSNAVLMSPEYKNLPNGSEGAWMATKYWEVYDNLKYLLDNPEEISTYAKVGYEFVKNNYTEEKVREFYLNTFYEHKIINDKSIF